MNSRITRASTVLAAVLLVTGGAVAPAGAAVEECGFQDLAESTASTSSFSNPQKDRTGLIGKVENASTKFTQEKYDDSLAKLSEYVAKITILIGSGKVAAADGEALNAEAWEVIGCVQAAATP